GGMFFAYVCLRPAAALLEPPQRLTLWAGVFARFFPWVWVSVLILLVSGHAIIGQMGGLKGLPVHIHVMLALGYVMAAIFVYIFFAPYPRLRRAVSGQDWPAGGAALSRIRQLVGVNLALGLTNIALVFVLPFAL
ncbi:MAG: CopD family protein, partial [Thiobacillaceae bacterium]|nr:CopD family protein [Thiobacillaceae bacterium]